MVKCPECGAENGDLIIVRTTGNKVIGTCRLCEFHGNFERID